MKIKYTTPDVEIERIDITEDILISSPGDIEFEDDGDINP